MTYLKIRDLSFAYQKKPIFSSLNLDVTRGEIFCLVGPNGCGKTTLQHCILNLLQPSAGEILVDGKMLASYSERELAKKMAFVPQSHTPTFPYLTADVVAMGSLRKRSFFGGSENISRKEAVSILEELGIGHLSEKPYTALSGGEMQMVMIARALCQDSEMLILDEPTSHLDIGRSQDILHTISRINKERKTTIIIATHDFNQPLFFQDQKNPVRMALMNEGHISDIDNPLSLLSKDTLGDLYGIKSQVITVDTNPERHFLAIWKSQ